MTTFWVVEFSNAKKGFSISLRSLELLHVNLLLGGFYWSLKMVNYLLNPRN